MTETRSKAFGGKNGGRQFFHEKNMGGVTPSVAAPDDTNPNDATGHIARMSEAGFVLMASLRI